MSAERELGLAFLEAHPRDAARLLEAADPAAGAAVLVQCPDAVIAAVLRQMSPDVAPELASRLPDDRIPGILSELPPGVAARILFPIDEAKRERWLALAPGKIVRPLRRALRFGPETAGTLMDTAVVALPADTTANEALRQLRRRSQRLRFYLYVVNEAGKLAGVINLRELMIAPAKVTLGSQMRSPVAQISVRAGTAAILAHPAWRELHALPVVDEEGSPVGILRREVYEELRARTADLGVSSGTGVGLALAELFWGMSVALVDQVGVAGRARASAGEDGNEHS